MKWEDKNLHRNTYSVSRDDLMAVWIETFNSFGAILVIWDAATHFDLLNRCGILVNPLEAFENEAITVELPSVLDAYEVMDSIQEQGIHPFMQVYLDGKLLSDNVGPIY